MSRVMADFEVHFDEPGDVTSILDGWTVEEVEGLLSGSSEALDELSSQGWRECTPTDVYVSVERHEVEAYLADRSSRSSPQENRQTNVQIDTRREAGDGNPDRGKGGVDGMEDYRTLERYECPEHGDTLNDQQAIAPYCRECHGRVDPVIGKYVPAEQLEGAVEALRLMAEAEQGYPWFQARARDALRALGTDSHTSPRRGRSNG